MSSQSVTLKDVYDAVNRLEDKITKRVDTIEKDVDELKGFQNRVVGTVAVISIFISGLATFIWDKITR